MNSQNYVIERTDPYKNLRQYWNGATWVSMRNSALPYADAEAKKLINKFNQQEQYQFVFRLEKVK